MTVWRVGMEAVCIADSYWVSAATGNNLPGSENGDVLRVSAIKFKPVKTRTFWQRHFGKKYVWLKFAAFPSQGFDARSFRPAQRNNSEIIARIKACRPASKAVEV